MKKFICFILCLMLVMALCACGGSESAPAPQASIEISADASNDDIAVSALKAFLNEGIYQKFVTDYENTIGEKARQLEITNATEYNIPDFEGNKMHFLMVNGSADVLVGDGIYDRLILLVDLDSGAVYDQYSMDTVNFDGDVSTLEGRIRYCMNCYDSYLMGHNDGIMTNPELETKTDLSADEIAAINAAIR